MTVDHTSVSCQFTTHLHRSYTQWTKNVDYVIPTTGERDSQGSVSLSYKSRHTLETREQLPAVTAVFTKLEAVRCMYNKKGS